MRIIITNHGRKLEERLIAPAAGPAPRGPVIALTDREDQEMLGFGAALTDSARDLRDVPLARAAVAVGSEGQGLSRALLDLCDGEIIIPMQPGAESLNAAVAASVLMWEMTRGEGAP